MSIHCAMVDEAVRAAKIAAVSDGAAAFRNLVANQYGAIDTARLYAIAAGDLDDLLEFCRALSK